MISMPSAASSLRMRSASAKSFALRASRTRAAASVLAVAGIALKFWFTGRFRLGSTLLYIGMGWLVMIALRPMLETVPPAALWLLLAGGLSYTLGTVFYLWKRLPYHHAIWHLFVLGGSVCHFFAVLGAVIPPAEELAALERVTASAFGQRHKMLRSSLKALGGGALCEKAGISPDMRAVYVAAWAACF